jgi:hypothetical protein
LKEQLVIGLWVEVPRTGIRNLQRMLYRELSSVQYERGCSNLLMQKKCKRVTQVEEDYGASDER